MPAKSDLPQGTLDLLILKVVALGPVHGYGQVPLPPAPRRAAPVTNITVDGSEAMFTTMCALLAAGFESNISTQN